MKTKLILTVLALIMLGSGICSYEGQYAWFTYNEGPKGNRCSYAGECDGQRTCSLSGWCLGISRPVKDTNYLYDESITGKKCPTTPSDTNYSNRDYFCDGERTCSISGLCQGISRPVKNADYHFNETIAGHRCPTSSDADYANRDYYCDGNRTCSAAGWCQGISRLVKNTDYYYDENTPGHTCPASFANKDYYCFGRRTCSIYGWCQGIA